MKMNVDFKVEYLSRSGGGDIVRSAYFDSAVDFDDFAIDMARKHRLVSALIYTSPVSDMSKYFQDVGDHINDILGVQHGKIG